jgi:hypothetical protein
MGGRHSYSRASRSTDGVVCCLACKGVPRWSTAHLFKPLATRRRVDRPETQGHLDLERRGERTQADAVVRIAIRGHL